MCINDSSIDYSYVIFELLQHFHECFTIGFHMCILRLLRQFSCTLFNFSEIKRAHCNFWILRRFSCVISSSIFRVFEFSESSVSFHICFYYLFSCACFFLTILLIFLRDFKFAREFFILFFKVISKVKYDFWFFLMVFMYVCYSTNGGGGGPLGEFTDVHYYIFSIWAEWKHNPV